MHVHGAASDRVVEQQHARDHIALHHGAGDAAVRDEMLDSLLLALRRHILDDLETFVGHLGRRMQGLL